MAADLIRHMASRCLEWSVWCAMFAAVPAYALTDPTKPPAELSTAVAKGGGAPGASSLQAVILSSPRRAAIIDGQMVELGANHGDAKLIEISESGVVLQEAQGRRYLPLFPGVNMKKNEVQLPMKIEVKAAALKAKLEKPVGHADKKETQ